MDETTQLAIELNNRARGRITQRAIRRAQAKATRARTGGATYLGYNADRETCSAKLASGEVIEAGYISNSGAAPGDRVAYSRGLGGAFVKAIPR